MERIRVLRRILIPILVTTVMFILLLATTTGFWRRLAISLNPPKRELLGASVTVTGIGFTAGDTGVYITFDGVTVTQGITVAAGGGWTWDLHSSSLCLRRT